MKYFTRKCWLEETLIYLDRKFPFETYRVIRVHHWILGLAHIMLQIIASFYICYYVLYKNQRYLERISINGEYRVKIIEPKKLIKATYLPYCINYTGELSSYQFLKSGSNPDNRRPCISIKSEDVLIPVSGSTEDTFNLVIRQDVDKNSASYVQDIETYTLEFMHGYTTSGKIDLKHSQTMGASDRFHGRLINQQRTTIRNFDPAHNQNIVNLSNQTRDRMLISDILKAGNFSLNDPCYAHDRNCKPYATDDLVHTWREEGTAIYLIIEYLDTWDRKIEYTYRVQQMEGLDWTIYTPNICRSGVIHHTAIHFRVIFTGTIGQYNVIQALVEVGASMFLLSLAHLIIKNFAIYFMPKRLLYINAMYKSTKKLSKIAKVGSIQNK